MGLRGTCGVRFLLSFLAAVIVVIPLVNAPPARAVSVRIDCRTTADRTPKKADENALRNPSRRATSSVETSVSTLERRAEEIEAELTQAPGDERLTAELTRTRVDLADAMIAEGSGGSKAGSEEIEQQLVSARRAWRGYLKVAREPSPGLAMLVAPALFQLAELSSDGPEALKNVKAAAAAQEIVVEGRPGKDSWSTLSFYDLFAQRYGAAEEASEKAAGYAKTSFERRSIEKRFREVEESAKRFGRRLDAG